MTSIQYIFYTMKQYFVVVVVVGVVNLEHQDG